MNFSYLVGHFNGRTIRQIDHSPRRIVSGGYWGSQYLRNFNVPLVTNDATVKRLDLVFRTFQ